MNIPKITILLDRGYHPDKIIYELEKIYPAIAKKVKLKLSPKPSLISEKSTKDLSACRKIRVCSCQSSMGYRKIECLDGKVQELGKKL
nr:hypothetical protein [Pleurocapsa sp. FMAR1]